ncbi:hypothetical protein ROHU_006654 [Labeo rohita]|uniref:Secreted protein n=1 Tax=Labeo rohita TaxID=84645 RepID=A0A498MMS2_LABRO|nr:hypothetical protein ROHU_011541 [Labeo rohita]RXN22728.1 hypothetical protein ROHU_006654 [Labeo rohita]
MLVTMLTAMYMMVRVAEQFEGQRRNSIGVYRKNSSSSNGHTKSSADKAATTIQHQYRKYQQKKQKEDHK